MEDASAGTSGQDQAVMHLTVHRMTADSIRVSISATDTSEERQRIIFRGRVLKDGETLSSYGIEDGSVLHFVERPVNLVADSEDSSVAPQNTGDSANSGTLPNLFAAGRGGVLFHSMELDPAANPATLATQIASSLMGAISGIFNPNGSPSPNVDASGPTTATNTASTNGPPSTLPTTNNSNEAGSAISRSSTNFVPLSMPTSAATLSQQARRILSRPSAAQNNRPTSEGPLMTTGHPLVRIHTHQAVSNLTQDLSRLSTHGDGNTLFDTLTTASNPDLSTTSLLEASLEAFERVYWMLASGCREVREGMVSGQMPWDQLHNLSALLQDLPTLMVVQRRLLASIRSNRGAVELPNFLDVPAFLNRPVESPTNHTVNNGTIEPPE